MAKKVGRPALGITKKVSLTLTDDVWKIIDALVQQTEQSQSKVLRDMIEDASKLASVEMGLLPEEKKDYVLVQHDEFSKMHFKGLSNYKTVCGSPIKETSSVWSMSLSEEDKQHGFYCKNCLRLL